MATLSFDPAAGKAKNVKTLRKLSNEIASAMEDVANSATLSDGEKRTALEQVVTLVADPTTLAALAAGTYTSPATAGASTITTDDAIQALITSPGLPEGVKNFLRRLLVAGDPGKIQVDATGTPVQLTDLAKEVNDLTADKERLELELKDAKKALPAAVDTVPKADMVKAVNDLKAAVKEAVDDLNLDTAKPSGRHSSETVVKAAFGAVSVAHAKLKKLVS